MQSLPPIPNYFEGNHLARAFSLTSDKQKLITEMLNLLNSPRFPTPQTTDDFRVILYYLPHAGVPMESLARATGTSVLTVLRWITNTANPTWEQTGLAVPFMIDALAGQQPHPPEGF